MGVGGPVLSGEGVRRSLIVLGVMALYQVVDKRNGEIAGMRVTAVKKFRSKSTPKTLSRLCLSQLPRSLFSSCRHRDRVLQIYSCISLVPLLSFAFGNLISSLMREVEHWRDITAKI